MPLSSPPRNLAGQITPHDHNGIHNNDGVIRRISNHHIVPDGQGGKKISTMALQCSSDADGGMSVDLETQIVEDGKDARAYVSSPVWTGSIRFTAGMLRGEELLVGYDPLPENPYHGVVWGQLTRGKQRRLLSIASWFVEIQGVGLG